MPSAVLGPRTLDRLFPFHVLAARDLSIVSVGGALARIAPALRPGRSLVSHFRVVRPHMGTFTFDRLAALDGVVVVLRAEHGLELQGQFERIGDDQVLFAGGPVVTDIASLAGMGLELRDFPPHDSAVAYLLLLQSSKTNLVDLQRVSDALRTERVDLQATKARLEAALIDAHQGAAALQQSEQRYRTVVNSLKEVVFQTDADGRWTFLNPAWSETFGHPIEKSLGRVFLEFVHPEDREGNVQAFTALMEGRKGHCEHVVRYVTASGGARWVEAFARPLVDEQGRVAGAAGTLNDVTDRHLAMERTEAARQQMEVAKALAESANMAKSDFIAAVSHDIRTPLHALLGMAELMVETPLSDEQRPLMRAVLTNARVLRHLVGGVLDLARIEQGRMQLDMEPVHPREIAGEVHAFAAELARERPIDVRCTVDLGVPAVIRGDGTRLRQILINLVSNAVKFTERGSVEIRVSFDGRGRRGGSLRFEVSDTGMGIPAADQPTIFERFQRAGNSERVAGTGLGLYASRALVDLMRGRIGFSSREGEGSTFHVSVPCEIVRRRAEAAARQAPGISPAVPLPAARILVVEDYVASQEFARRVLRGRGHEVDVAATGSAGVALAARHRYDLILMDVQLPDISGLEAVRRIRSAEAVRGDERVPILAVTAHAVQGMEAQCHDADADGCVTKPLSREDLAGLVAKWADQRPTVVVGDDSPEARTLTGRQLAPLRVRIAGATNGVEVLAQLDRGPVAALVMDLTMPVLDGVETMRAIRRRAAGAPPIVVLSGVDGGTRLGEARALGYAAHVTKPASRAVLLRAVSAILKRDVAAVPTVSAVADGVADLVPDYLDARLADLAEARGCLRNGAFDRIESIGHNMKGTGTSYGFETITRIGRALEDAGRARDAAMTASLLTEFEGVLDAAVPPRHQRDAHRPEV